MWASSFYRLKGALWLSKYVFRFLERYSGSAQVGIQVS